MSERAAKVDVPVVQQAHVAVEAEGVFDTRSRRVPLLPVIPVHLRPAIDAMSVLETQCCPGAPVENVGPAQIAEVIDLEPRRLPDDARLEAGEAAAILPELELLRVPGERRARGI